MDNSITYQDCIEVYEYLYCKISRSEVFTFHPRKVERVCIENFLKKVDWSRETLFNYLLFGFAKYEGLTTNRGKNNIPSQWVFGQKVFGEYQKRDVEKSDWFISKMKKNYKIRKSDIVTVEKQNINIHLLDSKERKRFKDKSRKLIHCLEYGLYDSDSVDCIVCVNKNICSKYEL